MKNEIRNIINSEIHIIHKKVYKNIDYRKLITSIYNSFLKPAVYYKKNRCKKASPQSPAKIMSENNCDYKQKKRKNYSLR